MNQPMTPRQLAIVSSYLDPTIKVKDIIDHFHISPNMIYELIERAKATYPEKYGHAKARRNKVHGQLSDAMPSDDIRAARFAELYYSGATLQEIGDMQNPPISRERVRQILRKNGYPSAGNRPREILLTEDEEAALKAYEQCVDMAQIEKQYGINRNRLNWLRQRLGIPRRRWRSQKTKDRDLAAIHDYYYQPDLTIKEIAQKYGYNNPNDPCRIIQRLGYPRVRKPANFRARGTLDRSVILADLMNTELGYEEIANKNSCSTVSVMITMQRTGISGRERRQLIKEGRWLQRKA